MPKGINLTALKQPATPTVSSQNNKEDIPNELENINDKIDENSYCRVIISNKNKTLLDILRLDERYSTISRSKIVNQILSKALNSPKYKGIIDMTIEDLTNK